MHGVILALRTLALAVVVLLLGVSSAAYAQPTGVVLQLPTFSFFSVNTTVSAPDSGAGIAAAMRRAEASRIFSGKGVASARGQGANVGNVAIHATIHDRTNAPGLVLRNGSVVARTDGTFSQKLNAARGSSAGRADLSVAEIRRLRTQAVSQQQAEAERCFERGFAAESKGRLGVAAIYYRQAATRAQGDLRTAAIQRLQAVTSNR